MDTPAVSVVMSVYNGERFLSESIGSILEQSYNDFEFIIIDDGSTDNTAAILHSYGEKDVRIQIHTQENRGLTESLNLGCRLARGKYVARMDADDIAIRDRFLFQIEFMNTHPDIGVLGGDYELIDAKGKKLCTARTPVEDHEIRQALLDSTAFLHPAVIMRKAVLDAVGGYRNVMYAEDYDLWLRIAEHAQMANLPKVILQYRVHPDQVSVSRCREQALWTGIAQLSALSRRNGNPDPLGSIAEVTPTVLAGLGVSECAQDTAMARGYLRYIRNMYRIGEFDLALEGLRILHSTECEKAEKWVLADSYLWAAKLHWHKKSFIKCAMSVCRAFVTRPSILGRPLKSILRSLIRTLQTTRRATEKPHLVSKTAAAEEV